LPRRTVRPDEHERRVDPRDEKSEGGDDGGVDLVVVELVMALFRRVGGAAGDDGGFYLNL